MSKSKKKELFGIFFGRVVQKSVVEDGIDGENYAIAFHKEHIMAGIIPSFFPDVAFPEDLLLFMKGLHDERIRDWLEEVKKVNKPLSP